MADDTPLSALARKLRAVLDDEEWSRFHDFYQGILPRLDHNLNFSRLTTEEIDRLSNYATLIRQRDR